MKEVEWGKKEANYTFSFPQPSLHNMQKSVGFLYTHNELYEKEIEKTILFLIASKTIKYLGINLTKEIKDLYIENCRT